MYDKNGTYGMRNNTYTFVGDGKGNAILRSQSRRRRDQEHVSQKKHFKYTMSTEEMSRTTEFEIQLFSTWGNDEKWMNIYSLRVGPPNRV